MFVIKKSGRSFRFLHEKWLFILLRIAPSHSIFAKQMDKAQFEGTGVQLTTLRSYFFLIPLLRSIDINVDVA